MSPGRTLIEIERAKAELREAIRCRRALVAGAGADIAGALHWVDVALDLWRRLPLLVKAVPVLVSLFCAVRLGRPRSGARPWLALLTAVLRLARRVRARGGPAAAVPRQPAEAEPMVTSAP